MQPLFIRMIVAGGMRVTTFASAAEAADGFAFAHPPPSQGKEDARRGLRVAGEPVAVREVDPDHDPPRDSRPERVRRMRAYGVAAVLFRKIIPKTPSRKPSAEKVD